MENLQKNFLNEEQIMFLDHMYKSAVFPQQNNNILEEESLLLNNCDNNNNTKYFSNMNTADSSSNNNDNDNDFDNNNHHRNNHNNIHNINNNQLINGNSGLQIAEMGNQPMLIHIPFHFENNNVYPRDNLITQSNLYDQPQELQNNNMLLQSSNSDIEQSSQNTRFSHLVDNSHNQYYDQNEWSMVPHVSPEMYHNIGFPHVVLESPFPSPNLLTLDVQTTLPVSNPQYSLISFGDLQNFNYPFNSRRSHAFSSLYDAECQSRVTTNDATTNPHSSDSLCNQKPPVYTKWTEEEDELLRTAISIYGPHKWSLIAAHVPNRTPMQCSTRWLGALNPTIHKGRWTPEEDAALKEAVREYVDILDSDGHPQPIPWNKIASRIPHRTGIQCQARWSEALDPSVRKGKWSPEEDEVLKEGVRRYGRCWIRIAELIDGRTQRQCRTRWVQIRNKQAKIERDAAIAAKNVPETAVSTDDESNEMLTPPQTTPSTPAQKVINHTPSVSVSSVSVSPPAVVLQGLLRPVNQITTSHINQSPIMSPTETNTTESCVTTPENVENPSFNKSNNNLYLYS